MYVEKCILSRSALYGEFFFMLCVAIVPRRKNLDHLTESQFRGRMDNISAVDCFYLFHFSSAFKFLWYSKMFLHRRLFVFSILVFTSFVFLFFFFLLKILRLRPPKNNWLCLIFFRHLTRSLYFLRDFKLLCCYLKFLLSMFNFFSEYFSCIIFCCCGNLFVILFLNVSLFGVYWNFALMHSAALRITYALCTECRKMNIKRITLDSHTQAY